MSYGFEMYDSLGNTIIDGNTRLSRIIQLTPFSISTGASINIGVPGLVEDGTWAVTIEMDAANTFSPDITLNTGSVTLLNYWGAGTVTGKLQVFRY